MGPVEAELIQNYHDIHTGLITPRPRGQILIREPVLQALKWDIKNAADKNSKLEGKIKSLQSENTGLRLEIGLLRKKLRRFRFTSPEKPPLPKLPSSTDLSTRKAFPTVSHIIEVVSYNENISVNELLADRRQVKTCLARQFVYYLSKICTKMSFPAIGAIIGGRDHTTILSGYRKILKLRAGDEIIRERLDWYEQLLMGDLHGSAV